MKNPLVYIILLNYNGYKDTIECVESLERITYSNYKIIIVDNASSDESEIILKEKFSQHIYIQTGSNLGFAGGNNVGIEYALKNGADYVCLLNNDTIVERDFLEPLVENAEKDKYIGVVSGKICYYNEPNKIWFAGGSINPWTGITKHFKLNQIDKGKENVQITTGYVTGCLMLVKREVIINVGMMNDKYFLYYEETDWNVRIRRYGYKIIVDYRSKIYHKISASTSKVSNLTTYYFIRNRHYFVNSNYGTISKLFIFIVIRYILLKKALKAWALRDKDRLNILKRTYQDIKNKTMGRFTE